MRWISIRISQQCTVMLRSSAWFATLLMMSQSGLRCPLANGLRRCRCSGLQRRVIPASAKIESLDSELLQRTMTLNFNAHVSMLRVCLPFLKLGHEPSVVLMSSKNVPAPGPGAGAYSAAKAALTQMGRVAALELGGDGIRVNMLHPQRRIRHGYLDGRSFADPCRQLRNVDRRIQNQQYSQNRYHIT